MVGTGYTNVQVSIPDTPAHYNHAFGEVIRNKAHLKETIRKYNGEHGTDLIEVGNDKPNLNRKPPEKQPDVKGAYQDLRKKGWRV